MRVCHRCGTELPAEMQVFRASTCESCGADLRCCLNCTFYSPGAHWDCRETIDEPVRDKDRANFCSYFRFKQSKAGGGKAGGTNAGNSKSSRARDAFENLFGN